MIIFLDGKTYKRVALSFAEVETRGYCVGCVGRVKDDNNLCGRLPDCRNADSDYIFVEVENVR